MGPEYIAMFVMLGVALGVGAVLFGLTSILGPRNPSPEKNTPYESGSESQGAQGVRLTVKFYLTAILFVVFDVEAVFLYPWATVFRDLGWLGFAEMATFVTVLAVTLMYAWRKGALEWQR